MAKLTRIQLMVKHRARDLRRSMSEAGKCLWRHLRKGQMGGYQFRRQYPYGHYVLDFVCLEAKLVIEVVGPHSNLCMLYERTLYSHS